MSLFSSRLHEAEGTLAEHVTMGECWARDGLQNEAQFVPTELKVEMITGMVDAGFKRIEATNFARPSCSLAFEALVDCLRGDIEQPRNLSRILGAGPGHQ